MQSEAYLIGLLDSNLNNLTNYLIAQKVEVPKEEIQKLQQYTPKSSYIAIMKRIKSYRNQIEKQLEEIKSSVSQKADKVAKLYVEIGSFDIPKIILSPPEI